MHWHVRGAQVAFRFNGLAKWLKAGLTFWWFDHNWAFSIPPPFINTLHTSGVWEGLDTAAWGSHVYYSVVAAVARALGRGAMAVVVDRGQRGAHAGRPAQAERGVGGGGGVVGGVGVGLAGDTEGASGVAGDDDGGDGVAVGCAYVRVGGR